jgi:hypothetical protein
MIQVITDFEEMPQREEISDFESSDSSDSSVRPLESRAVMPKQWSTRKKGKIGKNVR